MRQALLSLLPAFLILAQIPKRIDRVGASPCNELSSDGTVRRVQESPAFARALVGIRFAVQPQDSTLSSDIVARLCAQLRRLDTLPPFLRGDVNLVSVIAYEQFVLTRAVFGVVGPDVVLLNRLDDEALVSNFSKRKWNWFVRRADGLPVRSRQEATAYGCFIISLPEHQFPGWDCSAWGTAVVDSLGNGAWSVELNHRRVTVNPDGTLLGVEDYVFPTK